MIDGSLESVWKTDGFRSVSKEERKAKETMWSIRTDVVCVCVESFDERDLWEKQSPAPELVSCCKHDDASSLPGHWNLSDLRLL